MDWTNSYKFDDPQLRGKSLLFVYNFSTFICFLLGSVNLRMVLFCKEKENLR